MTIVHSTSEGSGSGHRISGNVFRVSFGTGRVIRKKSHPGSGSNLQTSAYWATALLTELLKHHDNGVSFIVMNWTTSSVIGHFVLVAHRIVYVCMLHLLPVYRLWNCNRGLFFKKWGIEIFCNRRYWKQSEMQHLWDRGGSQRWQYLCCQEAPQKKKQCGN